MGDLKSSANEQDVERNRDEDDVDIYGDLDDRAGKPNVITREESSPVRNEKLNLSFNEQDNAFDDDVDIYGDLKTFEDRLAAEELEAKVDILQRRCDSLGQENDEMKGELEKVKKINLQLKRNISSIFKTAKAEIERKDKQLKELQNRYDTLLFRRGAKNTQETPAQPTATAEINVQSCIKRDSNLGNVITLENETECTVKMGHVTLSFASEHSDFQKSRRERLEAAILEEKQRELKQNNENIPEKLPGLEEGEVEDVEKQRPNIQKSESLHHKRSRSRSRSPLVKRRRSPVRNHSRDRYERRKNSRSPPRSEVSRYRSRESHRSNPRSHGR